MQDTNITEVQPSRHPRVYRSREQWRTLVEKLKVTDLSHKEFCRQNTVTPSNLYRWRKIFAESSEVSPFIEITDKLSSTAGGSHLSDLPANTWGVELTLGQGMVLRIMTGKG